MCRRNMWGDGAAARSQSCLSFDVAVVRVVSSSLPDISATTQPPKQHTTTCHPRDILEYTKNFTVSHCNSHTTMEFGHAGVLNEDGIHVDMDRLKKGEVNLGTSIMAVTFKDGVILGADSRTTTGAYIANRVTDKLTRVHDTIWCCRSGSAADTQAVADIVQYQLGLFAMQSGKPPMTQTAASIFQEICYANKDRLSAGLIIAGWDERFGGQVYSIPLGGSLHKQAYAIGGSGSTYIYGYCDANWKEGMEEAEAVAFVKGALREAIKWDGSSGGVIRMVVLTKKGADRHLYLPDSDYKSMSICFTAEVEVDNRQIG
ncbi:proteasome subunit beta type-1 [Trichoderma asperellum]|uniref:Proteasome subunit beta n=1 Tax=Trichoderma asperellum TaxID=101201 RepID=A0A6V8R3A6_TRIAP|nr:proteasome subunit beta type-1 [Trichoderma asperellum]